MSVRQIKRNILLYTPIRRIVGITLLIFLVLIAAFYYLGISHSDQENVSTSSSENLKAPSLEKIDTVPPAAPSLGSSQENASQSVSPNHTPRSNELHDSPNEVNILVNKKNPLNPIDFKPHDLVGYDGYLVSSKIFNDLSALLNTALAANKPLNLYSTFRSYSNQVVVYNHWVRVNGSQEAADLVSARPGYSEHQTGFAIDFSYGSCSLDCFTGTEQYVWLKDNAHKFGFIERYPEGFETITGYSAESWHWRYIGVQAATEMVNRGIRTLEQLWGVPGGGY